MQELIPDFLEQRFQELGNSQYNQPDAIALAKYDCKENGMQFYVTGREFYTPYLEPEQEHLFSEMPEHFYFGYVVNLHSSYWGWEKNKPNEDFRAFFLSSDWNTVSLYNSGYSHDVERDETFVEKPLTEIFPHIHECSKMEPQQEKNASTRSVLLISKDNTMALDKDLQARLIKAFEAVGNHNWSINPTVVATFEGKHKTCFATEYDPENPNRYFGYIKYKEPEMGLEILSFGKEELPPYINEWNYIELTDEPCWKIELDGRLMSQVVKERRSMFYFSKKLQENEQEKDDLER